MIRLRVTRAVSSRIPASARVLLQGTSSSSASRRLRHRIRAPPHFHATSGTQQLARRVHLARSVVAIADVLAPLSGRARRRRSRPDERRLDELWLGEVELRGRDGPADGIALREVAAELEEEP